MRKTILPALSVVVLASVGAFGLACEPGSEQERVESPAEAVADPSRPGTQEDKIRSAIEAQREKARHAKGRVGILAEKSRYSLFDEELIVRDFFQDRRGGFFLDVGCAWAVQGSNTYYLEKHLGWKGIGIDALAEYGPEWKKERPASRFFSYLVTDRSGVEETFFKSPESGLSSTQRGMASGKHRPRPRARAGAYRGVATTTLIASQDRLPSLGPRPPTPHRAPAELAVIERPPTAREAGRRSDISSSELSGRGSLVRPVNIC
jgi:hypothetical protein